MFGTKKQSGRRNKALYTDFELAQQLTYYIIFSNKIQEIKCEVIRTAHTVGIKEVQQPKLMC